MTPPPGFFPLPPQPILRFTELSGPIWMRIEGAELVGGFFVEQRQCNPRDECHGGMLASFCDVHMAFAGLFRFDIPNFLPTITLSLDYIAPVPLGAWVEGRPGLLTRTRGMVFASDLLSVDGAPVTRATGLFKIPHNEPVVRNLRRELIETSERFSAAKSDA